MASTEPRVIKALAAKQPGLTVEPWEYKSRPLGAEDVEIAITHCGICGSDLHTITGGWGEASYPIVPGHEIVGTITAAGSDVKHLSVGDRVGVGAMVFACLKCEDCKADNDAYCDVLVDTYNSKYADGEQAQGGYAEYVRVSGHYAFKIPDEIPSDAAAPLLCAGVTVYSPLAKHVKPGQRVGVVGIGGLGHLALQFIRALGAQPVAFSRSANKEQVARELGAVDFVNFSDPADLAKARRSIHVLIVTADAAGQPWDKYLSTVVVGGTFILVAIPNDKLVLSPGDFIMSSVNLVGSHIGGIKEVKDMLALAAKENVRPIIQKLPMSEANKGIEMVDQGTVRYRVVLEN
ncbi:hypothetical protein Poli38472_010768 [Pythium oligandrum]|uniref:Enoyl reductase (ER) domain-containing protein n=1 Tax=Pythium oligandrum TaxID=41045 RepID=A0A8K1CEG6_PYTOL|nr:hypothetical protein Poli38472_010765 [Pythium oligandrum]TMW61703.1 hypothetical protein Poli38472_010766 [Pythium oligandrum]TMW61704.1 hypothetical protein Poli38472_010767 [Pythium oligandrum]TMW61705.1 hypothetical protein Poli38472_010768 [Pythium oligandrum]|eukprot:TMW61702.1 hypothetical protein Poli38472_010765 [Pythium oligandrum]